MNFSHLAIGVGRLSHFSGSLAALCVYEPVFVYAHMHVYGRDRRTSVSPCVCVCVLVKERRVRGYLQTETNQCVWDKKAAFMVYGNQPPLGLPPPCIITTTYSHDWWNMRLWNPSCFCYHPAFPSPPSFLFSQSFLSCSTSLSLKISLLCSAVAKDVWNIYKQEITHTAWGPSWKHVHARTHTYTHNTYFSLKR